MSLREQIFSQRIEPALAETAKSGAGVASASAASAAVAAAAAAASIKSDAYRKLKYEMHQAVLERVELERLTRLPQDQIRQEIATLIARMLEEQKAPASDLERRQLAIDVYDEMFGFGPIEVLLRDPGVSDILVNTARQTYVERKGRLELTDVTFYDDAHLMKVIEKIVSRVGRRIDESSPMVDARLPDGSRVNAIIPPLAVDGPLVSIRRFAVKPLMIEDLVALQTLTPPMADVLNGLARAKINMLVSGGTGSGKTTLLNVLSAFIPTTSASSRSRTPPNCNCTRPTCCGSKRVRPISKDAARSRNARSCATRCACGPTASSSAKCAARKRSTCSTR